MLALRPMTVESEFVKWILLLIAAMMAPLLVTRIAGADGAPGLLPDGMIKWARPMPETAVAPYFPEVGSPLRNPTRSYGGLSNCIAWDRSKRRLPTGSRLT